MNRTQIERLSRTKILLDGFRVGSSITLGGLTDFEKQLDIYKEHPCDLNVQYESLQYVKEDTVVAFEVLEHVFNPFGVLNALFESDAKRVIISVPLRVWFKNNYWGDHPYDRHYNEFNEKALLWMLESTSWNVIHVEKWRYKWRGLSTLTPFKILSMIYPRWIAVVLER